MLASDLTVTLMIMVNALVINQSSADKGITQQRDRLKFSIQSYLERQGFVRNPTESFPRQRHLRKNKRIKYGHRRNWFLEPVVIKLDNVVDKYEVRKGDLEALYSGVVVCGLSRCEKFLGLIPENQRLGRLSFCQKRKGFNKTILKFLSDFHEGVKRIEKSFHILMEYEKWPHLRNGSRLKVLEEFKTDIKTLILEVESVMTNKRLKIKRQVGSLTSSLLSRPKYQTHLMIYEWRVIRESKRFLKDWQKNLRKIFRCWKKRKRVKNKEETGKADGIIRSS